MLESNFVSLVFKSTWADIICWRQVSRGWQEFKFIQLGNQKSIFAEVQNIARNFCREKLLFPKATSCKKSAW